MRQYACPQCSAPVVFATPGAVFAVCASCQSMVVRRDLALDAIGTMAELPPDRTPLQVGAAGECHGRRFQLRGRLRLTWGEGSWNEWFADFGDGSQGWVAEAQGFFVVSEAVPVPAGIGPAPAGLTAGTHLRLDGAEYTVTDLKVVTVIAGEGELPFVARPGERWHSAELSGGENVFMGLEWGGGDVRAYVGYFAQPEEIAWHNLRPVPGWKGEPLTTELEQADALNCPACAGVIVLKAAGQTMAIRCSHCGTVIDTSQPQPTIVQKVEKASKQIPSPLPLGQRGVLRGVEWAVIGHLRRRDPHSIWSEYLLHNPWNGFAWLTEWNGHWNFVRRVLGAPAGDGNSVTLDGQTYKVFAREDTTIQNVAGEFYWRIKVGEKCEMADYVAPPRIASKESYPELNEETWSAGDYVPSGEVAAAFKLAKLPAPSGPFLNAPNPHASRWQSLRLWAVAALAALVAVQAVFGLGRCSRREVFSQRLAFQRQSPTATFVPGPANASGFPAEAVLVPSAGAEPPPLVTPSFELTGSQSPARIVVSAPVDNAWLGFDATLVNESTGEQFPSEVVVEYYHGYDDGQWSEGSQNESADLPAVPPGRYHLELEPEADAKIQQMDFNVRVERGGLFVSNFLLVLLALALPPLWTWWRRHAYEAARWAQSDFSP